MSLGAIIPSSVIPFV